MKPEDDNSLEDSWRRAFEDAELPLPPDGWERVEPHLPARPQRWRGAFWWPLAAALLLLIGGLGWWSLTPSGKRVSSDPQARFGQTVPEANRPEAARPGQPPARVPARADDSALPTERNWGTPRRETSVPKNTGQNVTTPENAKWATIPARKPALADRVPRRPNQKSTGLLRSTQTESEPQPVPNGSATDNQLSQSLTRRASPENPVRTHQNQTPPTEPIAAGQVPPPPTAPAAPVPLEALAGKDFQPYVFGGRFRVPPFGLPAAPVRRPSIGQPKTAPRFWVEGTAYVTRFNPAVQTNRRVVTAAANYSSSVSYDRLAGAYSNALQNMDPGNAPALSFVSFGIDARGGMRLTRHWYLEGGLQFLRGHSTLTSDVLLVDRNTSGRTSLYTQLLENTARSTVVNVSQLNTRNVVVPARNLFRYSFDYVSIPLSLGYRIRPTHPVNYTISAGLAGDVFLSNQLESTTDASIAPVRYAPSDGVYRRFGLSGIVTAGMALKLTPHWSLTARGLLRQALTPGIRGDGAVQMYPHTLGVGLGAQYQLNAPRADRPPLK